VEWLRLAPGELLDASFEQFLDGPDVVALTRGVRGDLDLPVRGPDVVEVGDIAGETLVTVEPFIRNKADTSATTIAVDWVGSVL
jgi:hypothetical protein